MVTIHLTPQGEPISDYKAKSFVDMVVKKIKAQETEEIQISNVLIFYMIQAQLCKITPECRPQSRWIVEDQEIELNQNMNSNELSFFPILELYTKTIVELVPRVL